MLNRSVRPSSEEFLQVYDSHAEEIWRYIIGRVEHPQDAEDLTSEVFLRAYQAWGRYDAGKASVRTWLFTIARHVVIDWWRKRRDMMDIDIDDMPLAQPFDVPEEAVKREVLRCIMNQLRHLPRREAEVISLRFGSEMTCREIGECLGMQEGATKMLIHRTIKKLRDLCL